MDHTDYVGRVDVRPPLNDDEAAAIARFARSRTNGSSWTPCPDGCCLAWASRNGRESAATWLRHLLTDLLGSGHRLDGVLVGFRRRTGELFSVTVTNNRVYEKVLREASTIAGRPRERTTKRRSVAAVIDLASHRASRR
jgi:hypothetical protein